MGWCEVVFKMNIISIIAGFLSGVIGGMGLGGGAVLLIYLRVFEKIETGKAQGINLLFFLPIAIVAVAIYIYKKQIVFSVVLPMALGGILGAILGNSLFNFAGADITGKIFAVFLIIMGIKEFFCFISLLKQKKCGIVKKE